MAQVKDPVCGMTIDDQHAVATSDYQGQRYYFCSKDCKVEFDASPDDYASANGEGTTDASRGAPDGGRAM